MEISNGSGNVAKVFTCIGYATVKCTPETTVKDICKSAVRSVSAIASTEQYCIQLERIGSPSVSSSLSSHTVLCPEAKWSDIKVIYQDKEFHLRVQIFPSNFFDVLKEDRSTLLYLSKQVKELFKENAAIISNSDDKALEVGCLIIGDILRQTNSSAFEKRSRLDYIDKTYGIHSFFPISVLDSYKQKVLHKTIKQNLIKWANLTEEEYAIEILKRCVDIMEFDKHVFRCSLGAGWALPIDLFIGPRHQISLKVENSQENKVTDFVNIKEIQWEFASVSTKSQSNLSPVHCHIKLILHEGEPLTFNFDNAKSADRVVHLIHGYCKMAAAGRDRADADSLLTRGCPNAPRKSYSESDSDDSRVWFSSNDYVDSSANVSEAFCVKKQDIILEKVLGEGQFGDVYQGVYKSRNESIPVAIKTCKTTCKDAENEREKFITEAKIMQKFSSPHIIRLIGVWSEPTTFWIVMELAPFGELRSYLKEVQHSISVSTLTMFCYQISTALSHLESERYVHRDIAARNILVSTPECVKLADFGMARWLKDEGQYKASKDKMPIKWLAPESIVSKTFTSKSDVWMFAVCMWETYSLGVKPFVGVDNAHVYDRIIQGERLAQPERCPPPIYRLMLACWNIEPNKRPSFSKLKSYLHEVSIEIKGSSMDTPSSTIKTTNSEQSSYRSEEIDTESNTPRGTGRLKRSTELHAQLATKRSGSQPPSRTGPVQSRLTNKSSLLSSDSAGSSPKLPERSRSKPSHLTNNNYLTDIPDASLPAPRPPEHSSSPVNSRSDSLPNLLGDDKPPPKPPSRSSEPVEVILRRQQEESKVDKQWLQDAETRMRPSIGGVGDQNPLSAKLPRGNTSPGSYIRPPANSSLTNRPMSSSGNRTPDIAKSLMSRDSSSSGAPSPSLQQDVVYQATTAVVRAVTDLHKQLMQVPVEEYRTIVKMVGISLKDLLTAVQMDMGSTQNEEVTLAEQVINADLRRIIESVKAAERYANTPVLEEYRRRLLKEALSLAVSAKSLFESVMKHRANQALLLAGQQSYSDTISVRNETS